VSTDDQNKSTVEQKPPDLEELAKNYLWAFLRRVFGPRGAVVIFVIVVSALYFHSEIGQMVSDLHAQIVQWWPLPKATPDVFTVALARLEGDDEKTRIEPTLAQDLQELSASNGIAVLEFPRTITADSAADVQTGHARAREWLKQSGAQVLIWGKIVTANGKSVPKLYWTTAERSNPKKPTDRYVLGEDLRLPPVFQSDLSDILRLLVVTQSAAFNGEEGHFVADRLRPFIERVRHLLEGDAAKNWTAEDIARTKLVLGDALSTVGEQSGDNAALSEAIELYKEALEGLTRQQYPLDWAMTQDKLGNALRNLGERESGTQHLTDAVAAFQAALQERTQTRVPLDWAVTQNNLGLALADLGERTHDTSKLCEALGDHVGAWQVFSVAAPYNASIAVAGAKKDVDAIHTQSPGSAPQCLQIYSAELKQMGVANAAAPVPPS
jgi:hypothetical protein